jgi:23S rRNA (adenine2503-C2)-methyltransferase
VLIGDVTYTTDAAFELVQLLRFRRCKLNLIPLNAADDIPLRSPTAPEIASFEEIVRKTGLQVYTRKPKGRDILAACSWRSRLSRNLFVLVLQWQYQ